MSSDGLMESQHDADSRRCSAAEDMLAGQAPWLRLTSCEGLPVMPGSGLSAPHGETAGGMAGAAGPCSSRE